MDSEKKTADETTPEKPLGSSEAGKAAETSETSQTTADSEPQAESGGEREEEKFPDNPEPLPPPSGKVMLAENIIAALLLYMVLSDRLTLCLHQNDSPFRAIQTDWLFTPFYIAAFAVPALLWVICLVRLARAGHYVGEDKTYRLPLIAVILLVSFHYIFIHAFEPIRPPANFVVVQTLINASRTPMTSEDGLFSTSPAAYVSHVQEMPPPYWKGGDRLTRWNAIVSENCASPSETLPAMAEPGTLLVCVSPDRTQAWVQAVGLEHEDVGAPALASFRSRTITFPLQVTRTKDGTDESYGAFGTSAPVPASPAVPEETAAGDEAAD